MLASLSCGAGCDIRYLPRPGSPCSAASFSKNVTMPAPSIPAAYRASVTRTLTARALTDAAARAKDAA